MFWNSLKLKSQGLQLLGFARKCNWKPSGKLKIVAWSLPFHSLWSIMPRNESGGFEWFVGVHGWWVLGFQIAAEFPHCKLRPVFLFSQLRCAKKQLSYHIFFKKIKILVKFRFFNFENPVICSCSVCFLISNLCICACVKLATSNPHLKCFLNQNKQPPVSNSNANASKKKWVLSLAS